MLLLLEQQTEIKVRLSEIISLMPVKHPTTEFFFFQLEDPNPHTNKAPLFMSTLISSTISVQPQIQKTVQETVLSDSLSVVSLLLGC